MNHTDKLDLAETDLNARERKVLVAIRKHGVASVADLHRECFPGIRADEKSRYKKSTAAGERAVRNAIRRLIAGGLIEKTITTCEGSERKRTAFLPRAA